LTVFASHRAVHDEPVPERLLKSAQVIEMFHNVTLIIDDIVDESPARRKLPTLWKMAGEGGKLTAYMVAGYIVGDGYDILAGETVDTCRDVLGDREGRPPALGPASTKLRKDAIDGKKSGLDATGLISCEACEELDQQGFVVQDMRLLSELLKRLAIAECVQWRCRKQPLSVEDWRYLAREDTGVMFEICAATGARSQKLRRFGRLLGMLYHGCDDVADVRGTIGKAQSATSLGEGGLEDLRDGILTLPAALAIQDNPRVREVFCKPERTSAELVFLRDAFVAKLDEAEGQLDTIRGQALDEIAGLDLIAPEYLEALVTSTRKLSGRPETGTIQ
jgi:geranylgeranyl pyrophosphate synthase